MPLPPPVDAAVERGDLREYWLARVAQHTSDSYAGVPISKFPEDLRVYEHLLWESRANVVIELGTWAGGSALWFRDRLAANAAYGRIDAEPLVVSIDVDVAAAARNIAASGPIADRGITLLEGDVQDAALPERVATLLPPQARCLVVEDSLHEYDTTLASLHGFHRFVPEGGFFVVEDGCVDIEERRLVDDWPRGVLPALNDWLQTPEAQPFRVRRDLELYGISCHPSGFLERVPTGG